MQTLVMKHSAELIFLAFFILLPQFAFLAVEDPAGQDVAGFLPVELGVDPAAQQLVIVVAGQVGRAIELAQLHQGAPDGGRGAAAGEVAKQLAGLDRAGEQRSGHPQQIIPGVVDQLDVDPAADQGVDGPVVGGRVGAKQGGAADIGRRGENCRPSSRKMPNAISEVISVGFSDVSWSRSPSRI